MLDQPASTSGDRRRGSLDGLGASDHDEPFLGFRSYQFSTRQLARLLQLRGECLEGRLGRGRWATDLVRND